MPPVVGVPEGVSKGVTLTIAVFSKEGETPSPHDGFKTYVSPSVFPSLYSLFTSPFFLFNILYSLSILRIPLILLHLRLLSLPVKENTLLTCSSSSSSGSNDTDSTSTSSSSGTSSSSHLLPALLSSTLALSSSLSFLGLAKVIDCLLLLFPPTPPPFSPPPAFSSSSSFFGLAAF
ncbi:hypothetical protein FPQ18DRAFT_385306 [Pyronema domesticum]|nr:hypothetical protein FPQ18DRAFT_385306 [Pyronema domesticum]